MDVVALLFPRPVYYLIVGINVQCILKKISNYSFIFVLAH